MTSADSGFWIAPARARSLAWLCAAAAALAGAMSAPARAQQGDPPRGLGRDERTSLLARTWRAQPAVAQGRGSDTPRWQLEPSAAGRASLRLPLDPSTSLSLRLRRDQLAVAWRRQF